MDYVRRAFTRGNLCTYRHCDRRHDRRVTRAVMNSNEQLCTYRLCDRRGYLCSYGQCDRSSYVPMDYETEAEMRGYLCTYGQCDRNSYVPTYYVTGKFCIYRLFDRGQLCIYVKGKVMYLWTMWQEQLCIHGLSDRGSCLPMDYVKGAVMYLPAM
ncbi:hypothetical protein DPMN_075211 [Dreissena polymorpha]|uniref:Uncharacterized protein n=1 Tax=Dreissena polymorpha TaxID=45954 RepID=A0A9D3YK27_DREPO|nr:hypothetical protein DPMN_075211 [Dreissena polymorpha]